MLFVEPARRGPQPLLVRWSARDRTTPPGARLAFHAAGAGDAFVESGGLCRDGDPGGPMNRFFLQLGRGAAAFLAWIRDGIAHGIIRARVPPNALTLAGPVAMAFVFLPLLRGDQWTAGWVVLLAVAFDSLDGAVARTSGGVTRFGAYLDSVVDRYADMLLLFGLLFFLLDSFDESVRGIWLAIWCIATVGTVATSYSRARAEKLIPGCEIGFLERPERTVAIILGLISGNVHISLAVLAIWGNLIAVQRIGYTRAALEGRDTSSGTRYWRYRRGSAEHAMMSTLVILLIIFGHLLIPPPL